MKILTTTRLSGLTFRQVFDMALEDLTLLSYILDDERERLKEVGDESGVEALEELEIDLDGVYERMNNLERVSE